MTAKDELEGQRSCRRGRIGHNIEKTNTPRLMPSVLRLFYKESRIASAAPR
jgi:hypothetical protein